MRSVAVAAKGKPYGYAFKLLSGAIEHLEHGPAADSFKACWEEAITNTETFQTKAEMDLFKASLSITTPTKNDPAIAEDQDNELTDSDKILLNAIKGGIDQNRPSNKVELNYRSTSMSTVAAVIMHFKNIDGTDDWGIKPSAVMIALMQCNENAPAQDPVIKDFINSFTVHDQRDPQKGDTCVLTNEWTSPSSGKKMKFPYKLICGLIESPYHRLSSLADEDDYLRNKLQDAGSHIKRIMSGKIFRHCYEHALNQPAIWSAIGDPNKSNNYYLNYITACSICVNKMQKLTTHLVKDEAQTLFGKLFEHRVSRAKYPEQVSCKRPSNNAKPTFIQAPITCYAIPHRPQPRRSLQLKLNPTAETKHPRRKRPHPTTTRKRKTSRPKRTIMQPASPRNATQKRPPPSQRRTTANNQTHQTTLTRQTTFQCMLRMVNP